ncbi:MAG: PatB family C-S lyase [Phycisphaerae bacterium]|nr:PatB family C-S lyase [Phycisphaerae bacterium]
MNNCFDKIIDRRGTCSLKWDKYAGTDIIPLWVADMDFQSPPAVMDQLHNRIDHGVFGYAVAPQELIDVIVKRISDKYGWQIEPDWIIWLPGLVSALHLSCHAAGGDGDEIITFSPVYPPFFTAPAKTQKLVSIPLTRQNDRYTFDLEAFKNAITPKTKLLLLCNPHNPVGRVYDRDELDAITKICLENGIKICSDEIHSKLILDDKKHIPTATLSAAAAANTITLLSAAKTFNLPGLSCGLAIIPNDKLREKFISKRSGIVPWVNALGYVATLAAYRDSADWHKELIEYLRNNRDMVEAFIAETPELSMDHIEATYLAWIDVSKLNLPNPPEFFEKAGVGMCAGIDFGRTDHMRLNFGCPKQTLKTALERMKTAIQQL